MFEKEFKQLGIGTKEYKKRNVILVEEKRKTVTFATVAEGVGKVGFKLLTETEESVSVLTVNIVQNETFLEEIDEDEKREK